MNLAKNAYRLIQAAERMTARHAHYAVRNSVENNVQLYSEGYAEPGYDGEVIVLANWNNPDEYNKETRERVVLDRTIERLSTALEKIGVQVEWSDQWAACSDCGKLVRTDADSYSWTPSFRVADGELLCIECLESAPEEHLQSLEGTETANTIDSIDPADHGYTLVEGEFEHGWHPGQDASPAKIAAALKAQGVTRYLFQIDGQGQFDVKFSVYVHDDEIDMLDKSKFAEAPKDGPSPSEAAKRFLAGAPKALR